jgi:hypothetical protein
MNRDRFTEKEEHVSEMKSREDALAGVRDALAAVNRVPAAGIDKEKHETLSDVADDLWSLERALQNEIDQQRGNDR